MTGEVSETYVSASPSVIQALYHAATGKTESLRKQLQKNYVVRMEDIRQLYLKLDQQIAVCAPLSSPTVTISVEFSNRESQVFSSWERFSLFEVGKAELVDEVVLKLEFIIKVPGTDVIQ